MTRTLSALLALVFAAPALAVPLQLTHQGRLLDSAGIPLEGTHQLAVALYADASGGAPLWSQELDAAIDAGVFSIVIGGNSTIPLDSALFNGQVRWLGLAVDDGAELPQRLALVSVPYAVRADSAAIADALAAPLDWSQISGAPADADTLGALLCSNAQVPTWQGDSWICASPVPASVDVSTLSGTVAVGNLPIGTSENTVAAGDHTHSFSQITGELGLSRTNGDLPLERTTGDLPLTRTTGDLPLTRTTGDLPLTRTTGDLAITRTTGAIPVARLPVGTVSGTVAAGDHVHDDRYYTKAQANTGFVSVADLEAMFEGVSARCDAGSGLVGGRVYTSGAWGPCIAPAVGTNANPGESCKQIKNDYPSSGSGHYWIDPDGGASAFAKIEVYCDMSTDGGGWTLCYSNKQALDPVPAVTGWSTRLNTGRHEAAEYARNCAGLTAALSPTTAKAIMTVSGSNDIATRTPAPSLSDGNYYEFNTIVGGWNIGIEINNPANPGRGHCFDVSDEDNSWGRAGTNGACWLDTGSHWYSGTTAVQYWLR